MTKKEFEDLTEVDYVHFINDDPTTNPERYNWRVIRKSSQGIMIDNGNENPKYVDKFEAIDELEVSRNSEHIERWRLGVDANDENAWVGEITATFNRYELNILVNALGCAEYEGVIDKSDANLILDKFNIEHIGE